MMQRDVTKHMAQPCIIVPCGSRAFDSCGRLIREFNPHAFESGSVNTHKYLAVLPSGLAMDSQVVFDDITYLITSAEKIHGEQTTYKVRVNENVSEYARAF